MINFKNYRYAYVQCETIYKLIQEDCKSLNDDLGELINSLKEKWQGEDAPIHINNLINIHKFLNEFFTEATSLIVTISNRVVDIQETVNNISGGAAAESRLTDKFEIKSIDTVEATKKYVLKNLDDEYSLLDSICSDYVLLCGKIADNFNSFFENWVNDPKKEELKKSVDEIIDKMDKYRENLDAAREALYKVCNTSNEILEEA